MEIKRNDDEMLQIFAEIAKVCEEQHGAGAWTCLRNLRVIKDTNSKENLHPMGKNWNGAV